MSEPLIRERIEENVNTASEPSELKITDLRVANIDGAPKHCPLIKIYTNQESSATARCATRRARPTR